MVLARWPIKSFFGTVLRLPHKPLVSYKVENSTTSVFVAFFNNVKPKVRALNSNNIYTCPFDSTRRWKHCTVRRDNGAVMNCESMRYAEWVQLQENGYYKTDTEKKHTKFWCSLVKLLYPIFQFISESVTQSVRATQSNLCRYSLFHCKLILRVKALILNNISF